MKYCFIECIMCIRGVECYINNNDNNNNINYIFFYTSSYL